MALDPAAVGRSLGVTTVEWTERDVMLYALGVGGGGDELAFTTENSAGVELRVLPTFVAAVVNPDLASPVLGDFDWTQLLQGRQKVVQHRPMPVEGAATVTSTVLAMHDKGPNRSAVLIIQYDAVDRSSGSRLATCEVTAVVRGGGGFGGKRGIAPLAVDPPAREADHSVTEVVPSNQALVYRLSGDRHPLHSDPVFAARAGWERPILHGLCTYGYAGRAIVKVVCAGDPARFGSLDARFAAPVFPGEELTTRIWLTEDGAVFRTFAGAERRVVLDDGAFSLIPAT